MRHSLSVFELEFYSSCPSTLNTIPASALRIIIMNPNLYEPQAVERGVLGEVARKSLVFHRGFLLQGPRVSVTCHSKSGGNAVQEVAVGVVEA